MDSASAFIDVHYPLGDGGHLNLSSYYSFQERGAEFAQWAQLTNGQDSAGRDRGTLLSRAHGVTMLSSQLPAGEDTTLMVDGTLFYGGDTDRGRIEVLDSIAQKFLELSYKQESIEIAKITSSIQLSAEQQKSIAEKLKKITGAKQIKLALKVDPQLIGGFTIEIGSKMIDTSIRGQLKQISSLLGA